MTTRPLDSAVKFPHEIVDKQYQNKIPEFINDDGDDAAIDVDMISNDDIAVDIVDAPVIGSGFCAELTCSVENMDLDAAEHIDCRTPGRDTDTDTAAAAADEDVVTTRTDGNFHVVKTLRFDMYEVRFIRTLPDASMK